MTTHVLKTWPRFFDAVESGEKTFEVRRNDRMFRVGDVLELVEWVPSHARGRTGRVIRRRVTYVTNLSGVGDCFDGFVGMSIEPLEGP